MKLPRHSIALLSATAVMILLAGIAPAQTLSGEALVNALRRGGYVIVMRHTTTEAKPDSASVDLANCATQQNLTPDGRALARRAR